MIPASKALPRPFRAALCAVLAALFMFTGLEASIGAERKHGFSTFGKLKYPADFEHFDYVNPLAPKGGRLSMIGTAGLITFNSLNGFILKGDAAQGLGYLFDSLMTPAQDEPDSMYGLVAHAVELADDRKSVTFFLRKEAKFADGSKLTAEDVVNSFRLLKEKGHPRIALQLRDVTSVEALDPLSVRYSFTGEQIRDLPAIVAALPIFSKAYYDTRDFSKTTLEPPLGSGPYEVADMKQGSFILYARRKDYWAMDLPVNRGRFNFAELRYEYFRDRTAEFEALKAGEYDLREEFTSKTWATEYDIRPVRDKRLLRLTTQDARPSGAQGFFINVRRKKFADPRVRKALDHAFDFEWTNKNQFYGLYQRTNSFFENSDMKASGPPGAAELALLEPYRDKLPREVFEAPYTSPVSNGSGQDRNLLRAASKLLKQAGWTIKDGKRVNGEGEIFDIEFLIFSPTFERIIAPFVKNLKILGIEARIRLVDPSQYQARLKAFDFDIISQRYVLRVTPGVEIRSYWSSKSAQTPGSYNLSGINDPVVDELIEKVIAAKSRAELVAATRAIDRVLRARHFWVPHWYKAAHNLAFWDKFSRPKIKPLYGRGIIETWWYDEAKAAKLKSTQ